MPLLADRYSSSCQCTGLSHARNDCPAFMTFTRVVYLRRSNCLPAAVAGDKGWQGLGAARPMCRFSRDRPHAPGCKRAAEHRKCSACPRYKELPRPVAPAVRRPKQLFPVHMHLHLHHANYSGTTHLLGFVIRHIMDTSLPPKDRRYWSI